ncbi:hypothetical protein Tco_0844030 [Tanacetum coccineum]
MRCLSPKSTAFNEFSSNSATAIVCLATNRIYNFSKLIFDGMITNIKRKGSKKFLMYPRFLEKLFKMSQFGEIKHTETYPIPSQTAKVFTTLRVNSPSFSGRNVDLFESMLVPQGEGPVNPTEPHHTTSPQDLFPQSQEHIPHKTTTLTSSQEPTTQQISTPSHTPTPRRLTKRDIRIVQSKSLTPGADEPASPLRDDSHGEAFPTTTSLDAGQDKENIPKTSAMPYESSLRVTSLGGDEGSLQLKLNELMDFCTKLQSQHSQMTVKIQSQDLEISQLKTRIKTLEDAQTTRGDVQEDAPNRGGMMDQGEYFGIERDSNKRTDKGSESTGEMANVLCSMGAANILSSGGLKEVFTTASPPVPPVSLFVPTVAATASEKDSTAAVITTTTAVTPYTRRTRASRRVVMTSSSPIPINIPSISKEDKGKGIMTEPAKPTK